MQNITFRAPELLAILNAKSSLLNNQLKLTYTTCILNTSFITEVCNEKHNLHNDNKFKFQDFLESRKSPQLRKPTTCKKTPFWCIDVIETEHFKYGVLQNSC